MILLGTSGGGAGLESGINQVLQGRVLLGADLLEDVWKQLLELLGLWGASNGEEVFAHGELD